MDTTVAPIPAGTLVGAAAGTVGTPVTVTGSPFTYTNNTAQAWFLVILGGTVSLLEVSRDGGASFYSLVILAGEVLLGAADRVRITYVVPPTVTAYPL
jgi:hypothetical protein